MAHLRKRHLTPLLSKSLHFSPIVGIFGHRQVGKTTLGELLADRYVTLDSTQVRETASQTPESFIESNAALPLAIDECQLSPPLFPALKDYVRTHKKPGQFLLTGSVRFSSRKAIRESLTGRMVAWELLPMEFSEINSLKLGQSIPALIRHPSVELDLPTQKLWTRKSMESYLENGGLPGVFAIRGAEIRAQRFDTQINTLLERDLRLILQTTVSYSSLRNLLSLLSLRQNQPLEKAGLARLSRISIPTLNKLIAAFENTFLIRLITTEGSEKKQVLFFEDQGEATHLAQGRTDALTDLTRYLYSQLRAQFHYRPELRGRIFQYRNRSGAYVPLCFAIGQNCLGIIPTLESRPTLSDHRGAQSFLKYYPHSKVIFVHTGSSDTILQRNMRCISVGQLL